MPAWLQGNSLTANTHDAGHICLPIRRVLASATCPTSPKYNESLHNICSHPKLHLLDPLANAYKGQGSMKCESKVPDQDESEDLQVLHSLQPPCSSGALQACSNWVPDLHLKCSVMPHACRPSRSHQQKQAVEGVQMQSWL